MKKIIVFGSINADLSISTNRIPSNGETIRGSSFRVGHGGKGANQAVAAAKLGGDVKLIGCVGEDEFGIEGLASLNKRFIKSDYIRVIPNESTGIAIIIKTQGDNRIILDEGANKYLKASFLEEYLMHNESKDDIYISQLENDLEEIEKAIILAKKAGMFTILNPAPAIKLNEELYKYIDLLIVNQSEAQLFSDIYPSNIKDAKTVFKLFNSLGLKKLIITLGKEGSIVITEDLIKKIEPYSVDAIDTTGAGDSYIGALAYGLANNFDLIESAVLGSKVSALCVTKYGTQRAMPSMDEVIKYFKEV